MDRRNAAVIGRRELLRGVAVGAVVATAVTGTSPVRADSETPDQRRKARYQPNSPEVQTFYRVNRYPAT